MRQDRFTRSSPRSRVLSWPNICVLISCSGFTFFLGRQVCGSGSLDATASAVLADASWAIRHAGRHTPARAGKLWRFDCHPSMFMRATDVDLVRWLDRNRVQQPCHLLQRCVGTSKTSHAMETHAAQNHVASTSILPLIFVTALPGSLYVACPLCWGRCKCMPIQLEARARSRSCTTASRLVQAAPTRPGPRQQTCVSPRSRAASKCTYTTSSPPALRRR